MKTKDFDRRWDDRKERKKEKKRMTNNIKKTTSKNVWEKIYFADVEKEKIMKENKNIK